jgi:zinc protease
MAFNGTEHFPKHKLIEFMESIGMRFGPELNALTGFDYTTYILTIPTESLEVVKTAFQILEDWAHGLMFDHVEIDKERGVIIEEWRGGRGASERMQNKQFPILFKDSRYAKRLPIGDIEIIENFDHEALKRFYEDWYRPDLMAVIAVGDFKSSDIKTIIEKHFANIQKSSEPRPRPIYEIPDHEETLFAIATDKEATRTRVSVYHKLPLRDMSTVGATRQKIVELLYNSMLNQRFSELARQPNPPFIGAFSGQGRFIRSKEVYMLSASVKEGGIEQGLESLYTESERVTRFGFTQSELERKKLEIMRLIERSHTEREKTNSIVYASEYKRNFLYGEPFPGIEYEFELFKRLIPEIRLEEINKLGREWITGKNRVILVNSPEKEGVQVPSEGELLSVIETAAKKEIEPYEDLVSEAPLVAVLPDPGEIRKTKVHEEISITEWELSNGVRVILKPTDFKEDEIVFRATSPGGTSLASDEDFIAAMTAAQVISVGGIGEFNSIDLRKKLAGKVARVSPFINELEEGLAGSASPKDLDTLFQLIYLTFTAPRADINMFNVMKTQTKSMLANRKASPSVVFSDKLQTIMTQNHHRGRPFSVELIKEMNLEKSYSFYRDRFSDASDFTFIFIGNLDLESIKPMVKRYLATLPSTERDESWRDVGIDPPQGVIRDNVRKGIEPKSQTIIIFSGPFQYDRLHRNAIRATGMILETRLRNVLREDLGGTYSVSVAPSYSKFPDAEYRIGISFGSDPQRVEELTEVVFQEIEGLKDEGPTENEVNDARETLYRTHETGMKQNGWLLTQLYFIYRLGNDPGDLFVYEESLKLLSSEVIKEATQNYFDMENYVLLSLFPEEESKNQTWWDWLPQQD